MLAVFLEIGPKSFENQIVLNSKKSASSVLKQNFQLVRLESWSSRAELFAVFKLTWIHFEKRRFGFRNFESNVWNPNDLLSHPPVGH